MLRAHDFGAIWRVDLLTRTSPVITDGPPVVLLARARVSRRGQLDTQKKIYPREGVVVRSTTEQIFDNNFRSFLER